MGSVTPGGPGTPTPHESEKKLPKIGIGRGRQVTPQPANVKPTPVPTGTGSVDGIKRPPPKALPKPPNPKTAKKVEWVAADSVTARKRAAETPQTSNTNKPLSAKTTSYAAAQGDLKALQQMRARGVPWEKNTLSKAIENGHIHILRWAIKEGIPVGGAECRAAARIGDIGTLQKLKDGRFEGMKKGIELDPGVANAAAESGDVDTLEYAIKNGASYDSELVYHAGKSGDKDMITYLRTNAKELAANSTDSSETDWQDALATRLPAGLAEGGNKATYIWAASTPYVRFEDKQVQDQVSAAAAKGGKLDMLQWLHDKKGFAVNHNTVVAAAARNGDQKMLEWLVSKGGAKLDHQVCHIAARNGDLKMIEWALKNGAPPLDTGVVRNAASRGHLHILEFVKSTGKLLETSVHDEAFGNDRVDVMKWLQGNGYKFDFAKLEHDAMIASRPNVRSWAQQQQIKR